MTLATTDLLPIEDLPLHLYPPRSPLQVTVVSNRRLTPPDSPQDVRHVEVRWPAGQFRFVEGQSVGIAPPGLNSRGRPHPPRLYSVACARDGEQGDGQTLALTVKRYVYTDESGVLQQGLSSSLLCDAQPGQLLPMTGPVGKDLLLPPAGVPLILLATGTGIAPFRGFLQQLDRTDDLRPVWLFQGAQTAADLLYAEELEAWAANQPHHQLIRSCSREQTAPDGGRRYVQHDVAAHGAALWSLLAPEQGGQPRAQLFLCGLKGMETGVLQVLAELAQQQGLDGQTWLQTMRQEHRLHVEVY
jgi:ferredoxin--NADP+ reductase